MIRAAVLALTICLIAGTASAATRVKDITSIRGVRANQLVGYGLVVGLNGTGDSLRNSPFTEQSIGSMLERMGVSVRDARARTRNVAAVIVTAELPAFIGRGSKIDVTVSSLGDATSLQGGSLILTPLTGADDKIYAAAQGPVAISGFASIGKAESLTHGVPTTGRISNGAMIEREAPGRFDGAQQITLELKNPDFTTAINIADSINSYSRERFGMKVARAEDLRSVIVERPRSISTARFMAEVGDLQTMADSPARVVIDERTGTIVIGADVQISTVAVTHGNLTVRVTETPQVSQPRPFSDGETVVTPQTEVSVNQKTGNFAIVHASNLETLVAGLNRMGLKPIGIIAILQAIKSAGALQAELVVQ